MRAAIEQAGAERALLILSREPEPRIAAEATSGKETVTVRLSDEPVDGSMLPETVFRYVLHTRESVVLDDAVGANPFSADPYIENQCWVEASSRVAVLCVRMTYRSIDSGSSAAPTSAFAGSSPRSVGSVVVIIVISPASRLRRGRRDVRSPTPIES